MGIEDLRKANKNGRLSGLITALQKNTSFGKNKDFSNNVETYYPERNKQGNASVIIRFLPGLESENFPMMVELRKHSFQERGWYIEKCLGTFGDYDKCPACEEANMRIAKYGRWNDVPKAAQADIRKFFSRKEYYSNILVVDDKINPENNGKVFLFQYGKQVFDMIMSMANPDEFDEKDPVNIFDLEYGANFNLRISKENKYTTYEKSKFMSPSPVSESHLKTIEEDSHELLPIISEKRFKSPEELKKRFDKVMGRTNIGTSSLNASDLVDDTSDDVDSSVVEDDDLFETKNSNTEDDLAYFRDLVADSDGNEPDVPF